jgi:prephenate dehydratase
VHEVLADEGINLSKLESRPVIGHNWNNTSYMDFETALISPKPEGAGELEEIRFLYQNPRSYEKGKFIEG